MHNDKCLLVEFVNEDNSVAVGFQDWLVNKKYNKNLQQIVNDKEVIEILWPSCEIKSAMHMKKLVKSLTDKDWTKTAVTILAFGGMLPIFSQKF